MVSCRVLGQSLLAGLLVAGAPESEARQQGGTLTVPIITQTFVSDFNPYSGAQVDMVSGTMYEPLWVLNTRAGEIEWRLATGFSYAEDLTAITINLRAGLTWSDGEPLDATDLV